MDIQKPNINRGFTYYSELDPELCSDSEYDYEAEFNPELFDFQRSQLLSYQKQDLFKNLSRKLIIKFLTSNIRLQTEPSGGGVDKADLETYEFLPS